MSISGAPRHIWCRILIVLCGLISLGYALSDTLGLSEGLFDLPLGDAEQIDMPSDPVVPEDPPVVPPIVTPMYSLLLEWQLATYLLGKEDITLSEYTCDPSKPECKINLLVMPQKDGETDSQLTCSMDADFEIVSSASGPCNPNTSIVPPGDHRVMIQILQKSDNSVVFTREILLKNSPIVPPVEPPVLPPIDTPAAVYSALLEWQIPTYLLGKEDMTLSEYICDMTKDECEINLKITPQKDGVNDTQLTCSIISDFEIVPSVSDPCNPNTSVVPLGDHIITLQILQKSDNSVMFTREILLKNSPIVPPEDLPVEDVPIPVYSSLLEWQQYTYLLEKENVALSEYTCDSSKPGCKINLRITPLSDGTPNSHLTCEITTDFTLNPTTDPCNPNNSLVPVGDHILHITILDSLSHTSVYVRDVTLHGPVPPASGGGSSSGGGSGVSLPLLNLSASRITIQSGLDSDGRCRSDTCQANFLAEVPANAVCRWDFGTGIFETTDTNTKCNPGYVKFPFDANIKLTVSDPNNPVNQVILNFHIYHENTPLTSSSPKAQIDIQGVIGNNKRLIPGGILCEIGNDDACSLNFTGEKSANAKRYFWDFGNQTISDKENPSAQKYPLGQYVVRLVVTNDLGISAEAYYEIQVVKKFDILPEKVCLNCQEMVGKIQISAVLPNPPHADTVEWIELKNLSSETWNLDTCILSDETKKFALSETISAGKTLRLHQIVTGLSLGNTKETLELRCGDILVDTFSWEFEVPEGYILSRDTLDLLPVRVDVVNVVDGDTIDVMLRNKKTRIRLLGVDTPETVHPQKAVEKFGREASDFTKKILNGKTVWMTFDHELLDKYGRTLAYIWECDNGFDITRCTMFNSRLVSEGYGRMERRFGFLYYDQFNTLEGIAKKAKLRIWSDPEVAKALGAIGDAEEEQLKKEQEEEYLKLQKELLELEKLKCKADGTCEDILSWAIITEKMSTFSVRTNASGTLTVSGRTWGDFPVKISFFLGDVLAYSSDIMTDSAGKYEFSWYPKILGEYRVEAIFQNPEPLPTDVAEDGILKLEKNIVLENLSDHFLSPLTGAIVLQGIQGTKNRWIGEDGVFHCLSRGSCSVNLTAEINRKKDIRYEWTLPNGTVSIEKNPPALQLAYGDYTTILKITDEITGEKIESVFRVRHRTIPKAPQKAPSSKYTIDLKDATLDTGGGVVPEQSSAGIGGALLTIFLLSLSSFALFGKQSKIFIDK